MTSIIVWLPLVFYEMSRGHEYTLRFKVLRDLLFSKVEKVIDQVTFVVPDLTSSDKWSYGPGVQK